MLPKRKDVALQVEERRRKAVFEMPSSPSPIKATNMANALNWHSWGWSMIDAYTKARVSKKSFKRYRLNKILRQYMIQKESFIILHSYLLGRLLILRKEAMALI